MKELPKKIAERRIENICLKTPPVVSLYE